MGRLFNLFKTKEEVMYKVTTMDKEGVKTEWRVNATSRENALDIVEHNTQTGEIVDICRI